jgi:uncharacterized protein YbbC (DUF1343 family)
MTQVRKKAVKLGLEKLLGESIASVEGLRAGLICNQSSVDHEFRHAADLLFGHPQIELAALFGPQHGIRGDVQDNMVETSHAIDEQTGLPVYSLYSETREPTAEMLSNLDCLIFDLQDVGCRVYTFIYTMANAMIACAREGKKFIVLDRPNPINGTGIEGGLLEKGHESFVGMYPIPMRHGMTVGELALLFNKRFSIGCELEIVKMEGWEREDFHDETDAPWVMPSPNMPTVDTAVVFPGTVFFEGTQISEGRGTTRPFETVGAPFICSNKLVESLKQLELPGVIFRANGFLPTFQKHANTNCGGVFLHVTDRNAFKPVITGLAVLKTIYDLYPEEFKWKIPPYEYVFDRNPFDVIAGTARLREALEQKVALEEIEQQWKPEEMEFKESRRQFLLY